MKQGKDPEVDIVMYQDVEKNTLSLPRNNGFKKVTRLIYKEKIITAPKSSRARCAH